MKSEQELGHVMRWVLHQSMEQAPSAPTADELLGQSQPWWETKAERFQKLVERLRTIQVAYGHASPVRPDGRDGQPVACILVRTDEETEILARPIYFSVRQGRLRFRFRFEATPPLNDPALELTFSVNEPGQTVFSATAHRSVENEYSLEVPLPPDLSDRWQGMKVTQPMPFRLIVRPIDEKS